MAGGVFSTAKLHAMTIRESATDGSDFTNPDADYRRLFLGEDGYLHVKDSAGSVSDPYSGGAAQLMIVRKAADEVVNNSAVLQNDNDLLLALATNEVWAFECDIWYDAAAAADGQIAWTVPAGATLRWTDYGLDAASSVESGSSVTTASGTARDILGVAVGTIRHILCRGFVANGANAGNLQFQWAQNVANASDMTVRANSSLKASKLA